jgi:thymidylate kinase
MKQQKDKPILLDLYALSCTGKTTHCTELLNYFAAKGLKAELLNFSHLRKCKSDASAKSHERPTSILLKSVIMAFELRKLAPKHTKISKFLKLIKWCRRLLTYSSHINSDEFKDLDVVILDPSLSSSLKKFYIRFFQGLGNDSFVKILAYLENNKFLSDVVVFIEADIDVVMERRQTRESHTKTANDSVTSTLNKAFTTLEKHGSSVNFLTVDYNDFSKLEDNIRRIGELCIEAQQS